MAITRPARPGRCVVIVWRRRRIYPGTYVPKRHETGETSQGRHGGNWSRQAERRPEDEEMGDFDLSTPSRPWGDDDADGDSHEYKSEVSSASEYDADLFEPAEPPPPPLDAVLAPLAQSLADEALGRFFSPSSPSSSHHHHHHDTINPPTPPTSYTCPYYLRDPTTHAPCRPRAALRGSGGGLFFPRLLDLRRHLQTAHRRPPWCPACGARFARATARDVHVRAFACVPPPSSSSSSAPVQLPAPPAGLADTQLRRLARRPDPAASAERQWAALWRLCFGDEEEVPSLGW